MDAVIRQLINCNLFNHLNYNDLNSLFSDINFTVKSFKKNEVIFSPHMRADTLGIVLKGSIDVQKIFASGKSVVVSRRFEYELIADAAIFAKIDYYPSTITACEDSLIFLINKDSLIKLFSRDENIMTKFLESVSTRVLNLNTSIEILSINSVPGKIAYFLLEERENQNSDTIKLKFPKKTWAEHLNVSRPTLSRELRKMEEDNIISFNKRFIYLHNLEKLEELCSI